MFDNGANSRIPDRSVTGSRKYYYIILIVALGLISVFILEQTFFNYSAILKKVGEEGKPVITLLGSNSIIIPRGTTYSDAGATALDTQGNNISYLILVSNQVNTTVTGTYTVTYNVIDQEGNSAVPVTRIVQVIGNGPRTIIMNDTVASSGLSTYSGRQIQAEYVTNSSILVGKQFDIIMVKLKKKGSPDGNVNIGIFNPDLSVKKTFGTIDVNALTSTYSDFMFELPSGLTYQIQPGYLVGVKFTGGDNSNYVAVMTDRTNSFDMDRSYRTYYTTAWKKALSDDLTMILARTYYLGPKLTLLGSDPVIIQRGSIYHDAGATAIDNVDGNITSSIVVSNPVDTSVLGNYSIIYSVSNKAGNESAQGTRLVKIVNYLPTSPRFDKFDIAELNPTKSDGREWFSSWDNGKNRTILGGSRDPYDKLSKVTGSGFPKVEISGSGVANMSGGQPRIYVYDEPELLKWRNVEVTLYGERMSESAKDNSAGFNIGARSNHQDQASKSNCNVDTYYSRMLYDGNANFMKELVHPDEATAAPLGNKIDWSGKVTLPFDKWIGHKFVLRDFDAGTHVKLQMYLDITDGLNGGDWKLVAEWEDDGIWFVPPNLCGIPVNKIILEDNPSVFIRNTDVTSALYKKFSIREIDPLP
jgi:hypothetical protein